MLIDGTTLFQLIAFFTPTASCGSQDLMGVVHGSWLLLKKPTYFSPAGLVVIRREPTTCQATQI
jgi:hypothetical protein